MRARPVARFLRRYRAALAALAVSAIVHAAVFVSIPNSRPDLLGDDDSGPDYFATLDEAPAPPAAPASAPVAKPAAKHVARARPRFRPIDVPDEIAPMTSDPIAHRWKRRSSTPSPRPSTTALGRRLRPGALSRQARPRATRDCRCGDGTAEISRGCAACEYRDRIPAHFRVRGWARALLVEPRGRRLHDPRRGRGAGLLRALPRGAPAPGKRRQGHGRRTASRPLHRAQARQPDRRGHRVRLGRRQGDTRQGRQQAEDRRHSPATPWTGSR